MAYQFLWKLVVGKQNTLAKNVKCAYVGINNQEEDVLKYHKKTCLSIWISLES